MRISTAISMVRRIFPVARERALALAARSAIVDLGVAAGPLIGGFLLEHFSRHAAFFASIIVAGFAGGAVLRLVPVLAWGLILRDLDITEGEH